MFENFKQEKIKKKNVETVNKMELERLYGSKTQESSESSITYLKIFF